MSVASRAALLMTARYLDARAGGFQPRRNDADRFAGLTGTAKVRRAMRLAASWPTRSRDRGHHAYSIRRRRAYSRRPRCRTIILV
jgi:hypothetical protein